MSRRKIKTRPGTSAAEASGVIHQTSIYPMRSADTDEVELFTYVSCSAAEDVRWFEDYMRAHLLVPRGYYYDPVESAELVAASAALLASPTADEREVRRAIAILGHSPCEEALAALGAYGMTNLPFAGMAPLARDECEGLIAGPVELVDTPSC